MTGDVWDFREVRPVSGCSGGGVSSGFFARLFREGRVLAKAENEGLKEIARRKASGKPFRFFIGSYFKAQRDRKRQIG